MHFKLIWIYLQIIVHSFTCSTRPLQQYILNSFHPSFVLLLSYVLPSHTPYVLVSYLLAHLQIGNNFTYFHSFQFLFTSSFVFRSKFLTISHISPTWRISIRVSLAMNSLSFCLRIKKQCLFHFFLLGLEFWVDRFPPPPPCNTYMLLHFLSAWTVSDEKSALITALFPR